MGLIYRASHTESGRCYVGQTRRELQTRLLEHCSQSRRGCKNYFHRAIAKYGQDSFAWDTLQDGIEPSQLDEAERTWISELHPAFNLAPGGYSDPFANPRSKAKLSASLTAHWADPGEAAEHAEAIRAYRANNPDFTKRQAEAMARPEVRAKISAAAQRASADPVIIEQRSSQAKARWADPLYRTRMVEAFNRRGRLKRLFPEQPPEQIT